MAQIGEHVPKGMSITRHFQSNVEPLLHAQLLLHLGEGCFARIHCLRYARSVPRKLETVRIKVSNHHVSRRRMFGDSRGHNADGPCAGDQHVLTQHRECKGGMHSISQRIKDRCHLQRNLRSVPPDVCHRQHNVFGESASTVYAYARCVCTKMTAARKAIATSPANHMAFAADPVTHMKVRDIGADFHDLTYKLMTDDERHGNGLLRPCVPLVDVQVCAANPRGQHANLYIIDSHLRLRNVLDPESPLGPCLTRAFIRFPLLSLCPDEAVKFQKAMLRHLRTSCSSFLRFQTSTVAEWSWFASLLRVLRHARTARFQRPRVWRSAVPARSLPARLR